MPADSGTGSPCRFATGGEYTETYTGALSINSKAYLFEVVWNKGGEAAANTALAALKTVRIQ